MRGWGWEGEGGDQGHGVRDVEDRGEGEHAACGVAGEGYLGVLVGEDGGKGCYVFSWAGFEEVLDCVDDLAVLAWVGEGGGETCSV